MFHENKIVFTRKYIQNVNEMVMSILIVKESPRIQKITLEKNLKPKYPWQKWNFLPPIVLQ